MFQKTPGNAQEDSEDFSKRFRGMFKRISGMIEKIAGNAKKILENVTKDSGECY